MTDGYLSYAAARATQAKELESAIARLAPSVASLGAAGLLTGPGPVFTGIGASLAAACAPVWSLRSRGVHSWRLGAGDHPLPFPASRHPVFGVSQSGRSAETLAVLESVDPSLRHAVVNMTPSPIADAATGVLDIGSIPDSYASTIGYTATVAALGMLADAWDGGAVDEGWARLGALFAATEKELREQVRSLAPLFATATSADFVGTGPAVGSAEASALLFREVVRIPSTGMSTRQYLHGAMESAGGGVHVVFGDEREHTVADTLAAAGHPVVLVTAEPVAERPLLHPVRVPRLPAAQRAVMEILVAQILVEAVADVRGVEIEEFVFHNSDIKVTEGSAAARAGGPATAGAGSSAAPPTEGSAGSSADDPATGVGGSRAAGGADRPTAGGRGNSATPVAEGPAAGSAGRPATGAAENRPAGRAGGAATGIGQSQATPTTERSTAGSADDPATGTGGSRAAGGADRPTAGGRGNSATPVAEGPAA